MRTKLTLPRYCEEVRKKLNELWQANKYYDIILIAGDGKSRISAHRLILEAASPYFASEFTGKCTNEITVQSIDGDTLKQLVGVCYSGTVDVDEVNVMKLYTGAVYLQLNTIVAAMDTHIIANLDNLNCLNFYRLAQRLTRIELFTASEKYICRHFHELGNLEPFLELELNYLTQILALKDLCVPSAEALFHMIIKWIEHDPAVRDQTWLELMPLLRLTSMTQRFLLRYVRPRCKTAEAKEIVLIALEAHLENPNLATVSGVPLTSNACMKLTSSLVIDGPERLIIVAGNVNDKCQILEYSFVEEEWKNIAILPSKVFNFTVVYYAVSNSLCFVGGQLNGTPVCDVLLYNLQTRRFTYSTKLTKPRYAAGVVSLHDDGIFEAGLIVVGGGASNLPVERWFRKSNKWYALDSMNNTHSVRGSRLIAVDDFIYCIGEGTAVERYSLLQNIWLDLPPLHYGRFDCAVVHESGKLYVIGGHSAVIECYDIREKEWTEIAKVEDSWYITSCVQHNNQLFAFGKNIVLISDGDWKKWKLSETVNMLDKYIYGVFSVPSK